jgi:arginyl-tRNA synthetase
VARQALGTLADMSTPLAELRAAVADAAGAVASGAQPRTPPLLERPPRADFGDYSTNAAMLLAPVVGDQPRAVAERLGRALEERLTDRLERVEVAGPGFLNLHLADAWFRHSLADVLAASEGFGGGGAAPAMRVLVEFVSANPTGPLTVASGRHAAYGDALARILAFHGHAVEREYYFNDAGSQILKFGESLRARARGEEVPEDGYSGEYVSDLVQAIPGAAEMAVEELADRGVELLLTGIKTTLERFGVTFDSFFRERTVRDDGALERALAELERRGHLYRSEGASWLRSTSFGDDKDRVLERSSGEPTYLAVDIAYHEHKRARGYERLINVLGADHHGYVRRLEAAYEALGGDAESLEIVLLQFVHLIDRGARASMSKRRGEFVTLDELIDEIGTDVARYFLLQRSHDTTLELDLALAREQSSENPVYYVQYAHARIASIVAKAGEPRVAEALAALEGGMDDGDGAAAVLHPAERALVKALVGFPIEVAEAADRRAPHRLAAYALELAQEFTAFYRDCRVVGAEPRALESFRLALSLATQRTLARALGLLGVGAPAEM